MIKQMVSVAIVIVMIISLTGCVRDNDSKGKQEVITIKMNSVKTASDPEYAWWEGFLKEIEEKSNGTLECEIYPSESIGTQANMIEAVSMGAALFQDCDASWLSDYTPDFSVFMAPYTIQKPEEIQQLWESEIGQEMCADLESKGLRIVTFVYFGTRNLISNTKVESREAVKNLKVRCASTKMWNEVVRVLGGNATNTAWSETYQALSQGIADAAEAPYALLYSSKLYEKAPYIAKTEHVVASTAIVMSQELYEALPLEAQKAIDEAGHSYPPQAIINVEGVEQEYIDKLEAQGVTITEVDKAPFMKAAKSTPDQFPEWSDGLYDAVQKELGHE